MKRLTFLLAIILIAYLLYDYFKKKLDAVKKVENNYIITNSAVTEETRIVKDIREISYLERNGKAKIVHCALSELPAIGDINCVYVIDNNYLKYYNGEVWRNANDRTDYPKAVTIYGVDYYLNESDIDYSKYIGVISLVFTISDTRVFYLTGSDQPQELFLL